MQSDKKRYCMVLEIKEEFLEKYREIHLNAWPELLKAEKECGFTQELIWIYKNLAILYFECDDIDAVFKRAGENEVEKKWDRTVAPWFKQLSPLQEVGGMPYCEKIFDLNQQLKDSFTQY